MLITVLLVLTSVVAGVQGDYACLCSYAVETFVYSQPTPNSDDVGVLYEFDCKPVYPGNAPFGYIPVMFENKLGYVQNSTTIEVQICQGAVPKEDLVTVPTSSSSVPTSQTTRQSTATTTVPTLTSTMQDSTTKIPKTATTLPTFTTTIPTTSTTTTTTTIPTSTTTNATTTLTTTAPTTTTIPTPTTTIPTTTTTIPTTTTTIPTSTTTIPTTTLTTTTTTIPTTTTTMPTSTTTIPTTTLTTTTTTVPTTTTILTTTPNITTTIPTSTTTIPTSTTTIPTTTTTTTTIPTTTTITTTPTTKTTTSKPTTHFIDKRCPSSITRRTQRDHVYSYQSYCYEYRDDLRTWQEAKTDCQNNRGSLLAIHNQDEQNFVYNMLKKIGIIQPVWIGLSDTNHEGQWRWVSGQAPKYYNWMSGVSHPNYVNKENCVVIVAARKGEWDDVHCYGELFDVTAEFPWVCQYRRGITWFCDGKMEFERTPYWSIQQNGKKEKYAPEICTLYSENHLQ